MFLLCKEQNPRIMYYLRTFATPQKWNRIVEMMDFILASSLTLHPENKHICHRI